MLMSSFIRSAGFISLTGTQSITARGARDLLQKFAAIV
jgi:hypothetical protein